MATAIASLKNELMSKDSVVADLKGQVSSLQSEAQANNDSNRTLLENLESQLSKKDEDIQNLSVALQALQDMPAPVSSCPEPVISADASENNDPIIKYLEGKNAELSKKLESCGSGTTNKTVKKQTPKPKAKKQPSITNVIFENKWQFNDSVKCSSGTSNI